MLGRRRMGFGTGLWRWQSVQQGGAISGGRYFSKKTNYALDTIEKSGTSDILVEIPHEELGELAEMYRNSSYLSYVSRFLSKPKLRNNSCSSMKILSPWNCRKEDGTFFVLTELKLAYQFYIHTLDNSAKNVYQSFLETQRINFSKSLYFEALDRNVASAIIQVAEERKLKNKDILPNCTYVVPESEANNYQVECPDHLRLAKLEEYHSHVINFTWKQMYPSSEEYISALIRNNKGYGLFLKSTDELVACIVEKGMGEIGLLHTMEEYKHQGLASILIRQLGRDIAEDGGDPTGFILVKNEISRKVAGKLNFKKVGLCYDFVI